ncbi:GNAT family N-acetyltransferase [Flagellimonas sp. HMM57]|uniref:GNAT family N-acetyltransferase n=1 Tax=unclassified Flagellimonas TaxID=2644544 RepID=UPI0013CFF8EA|nr:MULTISPECIES: GNAT family protein [unclassified Flagellimonas]UII77324.1 GNAT family N-acetyltransferase [Flagellimonas sp. HMM57]
MNSWLHPIELEGNLVKLIPMQQTHREGLLEAATDGNLWELWYTSVPSSTTVDAYMDFAINEQKAQRALPFVIIDKKTNTIVGSTRFCSVDAPNRRVEIGYTWYAKHVQRTGINTECKYLLLQHAFETLDAIAVEFKTNFFNFPSRNAILRLGARQDGIIRNHRIDKQGNIRDTVIFSILNSEWPTVKTSLEFKMNRTY